MIKASLAWPARGAKFSPKKWKKFHLTWSMRIVHLGMERNQPDSLVIWAVL